MMNGRGTGISRSTASSSEQPYNQHMNTLQRFIRAAKKDMVHPILLVINIFFVVLNLCTGNVFALSINTIVVLMLLGSIICKM